MSMGAVCEMSASGWGGGEVESYSVVALPDLDPLLALPAVCNLDILQDRCLLSSRVLR